MSEGARDLLVRGVAAAKAGERQEARFYLKWVLNIDSDPRQKIDAWYWLAQVAADSTEKREYLATIVANDPTHALARRELAILDGKLKPEEIINPDTYRQPAAAGAQASDAQRFTCPNCGGRLTYTPDGKSLICEYCTSRQPVETETRGAYVPEQDFILSLATARGHAAPVNTHLLHCQGCGADFYLPAHNISLPCPYCDSPHVAQQQTTRETMPPTGIIPFSLDQAAAERVYAAWLVRKRIEDARALQTLHGMYLPAWTFDLGGSLSYTCEVYYNRQWYAESGDHLVRVNDLPVLATKRLSAALAQIVLTYDYAALTPYDPQFLANWHAETYQIALADASLDGRAAALQIERSRVGQTIDRQYRNLQLASGGMMVESYRLILLPVWMGRHRVEGKAFQAAINGQNGRLLAEGAPGGMNGWVKKLLGGDNFLLLRTPPG